MSLVGEQTGAVNECGCDGSVALTGSRSSGDRWNFVQSVDPGIRLLVCASFCLVVVSLNGLTALSLALGVAALAVAAARQSLGTALRRMAALDGFMLMVLAMLPFSTPGEPLFSVAGLPASREGALLGATILLKANAVVLMILALLSSMEPALLGRAMNRLRLPSKFVLLFLFTLRYIDVLGREYRRLRTAMKARGFRMRCDLHTWRSVGYLVGMLLVRSIERSERIVVAMRCRGFNGTFPALTENAALSWRDGAFAGLSLGVCVGLALVQ
ncbi:cobalt ECF transporter T component CbiQ [Rhodomicrobium sp.]|uniref:cobalt ECF transporter T component CbiQ n=1 Tax=Rhodomicrobium sp. TaxID=2720632 RepID=UPI0039E37944